MLNSLYRYLRVSPEELKALYTSTLCYMHREYKTMCQLLSGVQSDQARHLVATYQRALNNIEAELDRREASGAAPMRYPPLGDLVSTSSPEPYGASR